ncbi:MAG TPA: polysaccharide deacetylase family protein [Gaiellaceae bacterium]|nr:polysaccharide deacetylase family protein [Gaiellaceae bacterium]
MTSYGDMLARDTFAIFLFHGVLEHPRAGIRNYTAKHLPLDRFEEVLDDLVRRGTPVTMDAVAAGGPLAPEAFAITFDDGFANNRTAAVPALEARGVPATFYVTSGFVNEGGASWIDQIEQALETAPAPRLSLPFGERSCRNDTEKIALLEEIRAHVKSGEGGDPYAFAEDVRTQLGTGEMPEDPALDAKLTWDDIVALHRSDLFTVGGHGHTHRVLEHLDDAALEREVDLSLELLSGHLGESITHYSYPEGLAGCYSERVIDLLRSRGIVCAPTAEPGVNSPGGDVFRLKRITVI